MHLWTYDGNSLNPSKLGISLGMNKTENVNQINKLRLLGVTFGFNLFGVVSRARRDMHN